MDRPGQDRRKSAREIELIPLLIPRRTMRQRDLAEIVRQRDAHTQDARPIDRAITNNAVDFAPHEINDLFRHREMDFARNAAAHLAVEIECQQRQVVAIDVEPDPISAIGLDAKLHRRLSAPTPRPAGRAHEPHVGEAPGDVGDGRRGQPGLQRDLDPSGVALEPDRLKHGAQIVIARALQIGTRQRSRQRSRQLQFAHLGGS